MHDKRNVVAAAQGKVAGDSERLRMLMTTDALTAAAHNGLNRHFDLFGIPAMKCSVEWASLSASLTQVWRCSAESCRMLNSAADSACCFCGEVPQGAMADAQGAARKAGLVGYPGYRDDYDPEFSSIKRPKASSELAPNTLTDGHVGSVVPPYQPPCDL